MALRHNQGMPFTNWLDIEKTEKVIVLTYFLAGNLSLHDFAEDTVSHQGEKEAIF